MAWQIMTILRCQICLIWTQALTVRLCTAFGFKVTPTHCAVSSRRIVSSLCGRGPLLHIRLLTAHRPNSFQTDYPSMVPPTVPAGAEC
ncbi:hypothetical protein C8F04DRAFT_1115788 [Mycena alexandri]|uniref:Secreted protein n=1 Tax=Mycena alexandri TaxID=1745969 RepID=A0AAD6SLP5_9AGAR|nr:hypothetical protein C8F04DRAFT_1115788 [Mycena alexandri]